jgi:hypothetical protein
MKVSSKWFLRFQTRYNAYYVVCGLTPVRFAGHPMFFGEKGAALAACKERGYVPVSADSEELRKLSTPPAAPAAVPVSR